MAPVSSDLADEFVKVFEGSIRQKGESAADYTDALIHGAKPSRWIKDTNIR